MKYIKEYLKDAKCIEILGEIKLEGGSCDEVNSVEIIAIKPDGTEINTDIIVWYCEYAEWLENEINKLNRKVPTTPYMGEKL